MSKKKGNKYKMEFIKYPDMKTLFKLIPLGVNGKKWDATSGEILPETAPLHFMPLEDLVFSEKIDGTNMGIRIDNNTLTHVQKRNDICSRDNKGDSFYFELADKLVENIFKVDFPASSYFIFGELCGAKIQNGGNYFDNRRFLVFDIYDIENNKFFLLSLSTFMNSLVSVGTYLIVFLPYSIPLSVIVIASAFIACITLNRLLGISVLPSSIISAGIVIFNSIAYTGLHTKHSTLSLHVSISNDF